MGWTWRWKRTKSRRKIQAGEQKNGQMASVPLTGSQFRRSSIYTTGQMISSLACGSYTSILVNSGAKLFAFWQKTSHLPHPHLFTMPRTGEEAFITWCETFSTKVLWISNTSVLSLGRPLWRYNSNTLIEESFTTQNKVVCQPRQKTCPHLLFLPAIVMSHWRKPQNNSFPTAVVISLTCQCAQCD